MDECRRQRCERESRMLMKTARQNSLSSAQCIAPAFARLCEASDSRHAAASGRPVVNGV
jgi:hypothetical protein